MLENTFDERFSRLEQLFHEQFSRNSHNEQLIDKLYADLKQYQDDIVASVTMPLIMDIIIAAEDLQSQLNHLPTDYDDELYLGLYKKFSAVLQRLLDILYEHDVEPYTVEGDYPDMKRQKVVRAVVTDDQTLDGRIEQRLSSGWVKGGRMIKMERVTVYRFETAKEESTDE